MGDRANVFIRTDETDPKRGVYIYTHWGGTDLPESVQTAIAKKWRWDDDAYLVRIIYDVIAEGSHGEETGYGISTHVCDGADRVLCVDPHDHTVGVTQEGDDGIRLPCRKVWTFEEYIKLDTDHDEDASSFGEQVWAALDKGQWGETSKAARIQRNIRGLALAAGVATYNGMKDAAHAFSLKSAELKKLLADLPPVTGSTPYTTIKEIDDTSEKVTQIEETIVRLNDMAAEARSLGIEDLHTFDKRIAQLQGARRALTKK